MEFAVITNRIKQALIDNKVDVDSLIEQLRTMSAVSNRKVPLFDEDAFVRILYVPLRHTMLKFSFLLNILKPHTTQMSEL